MPTLRPHRAAIGQARLRPLLNDIAAGILRRQRLININIINAARGALINSSDLAQALRSGKVAGAALDVYEQEPPPADHPLLGLPNVVHTPHLAASTSDAQVTVAVEAAQLIVAFLQDGTAANVCNPSVLR